MKYGALLFLLLFMVAGDSAFAQRSGKLSGAVYEQDADGKKQPLPGVNVYWANTTRGSSTDSQGKFELSTDGATQFIVASFVGFQADTIAFSGQKKVQFVLKPSVQLQEVEVVHRRKTTEMSMISPIKVEEIGEGELLKAACCNLSESFETSPSVDVSFTDAITGTRQIQLLGLAGPYTQITREAMPGARGLASIHGLEYIPGTWIESIQLNKGTGSVVNGFESVAGQINVCLRQPETAEKLYLNGYLNQMGRQEYNLITASEVGQKWSTALFLHGRNNSNQNDRNADGFLDGPMNNYLIGLNRWDYDGPNGLRFQAGVKATRQNSIGGQTGFKPLDVATAGLWGMNMETDRIDAWAKLGKVYADKPWKSLGSQYGFVYHDQENQFGRRVYNARQRGFYGNWMYQSIISNTNHVVKTGASIMADRYEEDIVNVLTQANYDRTEVVPGAYLEYTYTNAEVFSLLAGIRADYNNIYGGFITPRLHARYSFTETTSLRGAVGRGQRTANIFADNFGVLASQRQIVTPALTNDKAYGLDAEVAWNYGLNLTQEFTLDYREGRIGVDFFHTAFQNQVVVNLDRSPQQVVFENLNGRSFSNSVQVQLDYELIKRMDVRLAYRLFDTRTTYDGALLQKPLIARDRAFINLSYKTRSYWHFDYTLNWQGPKRIPNTTSNPAEYQLNEESPAFFLMNAQIAKKWQNGLEIYVGAENLTNFRQADPILGANDPFGNYFDSSLVWGPIFGRNIYMGFRYRIK